MHIEKGTFDLKKDIVTMLIICAAAFLQALAINGFYVPHHFLSGGLAGISILFDYVLDVPPWITVLVLNVPICIVGLIWLDFKTVLFSCVSAVMFAAAIALTRGISFGISDPVISALAGAVVIGMTSAPIVHRGATIGGSDLIALIISRRLSIAMGNVCIAINMIIMAALALTEGLELALVSMLAMVTANISFNNALRGFGRSNTVLIISEKWSEIAPHVLSELKRGVTYIPAEGAYTGTPKKMIYCILKNSELSALKRIVRQTDANAIFSVIDTREVTGRGFGPIL